MQCVARLPCGQNSDIPLSGQARARFPTEGTGDQTSGKVGPLVLLLSESAVIFNQMAQAKPVSLWPLNFFEALEAIVKVDPEKVGITTKHRTKHKSRERSRQRRHL